MASDLPIDVVRERLRTRSITYRQAAFRGGVSYGVLGRIGEHDIAVQAGYIATAGLGRPALRGRLEPTATGTRADVRISRYLPLMWFGAVFVALAAAAFLYLVAVSAGEAFTGHLTGAEVAGCLVPVPLGALFAAVSLLGTLSGRREVRYLKSWLADCLGTSPDRQPPL
jgi:hypothetical protein